LFAAVLVLTACRPPSEARRAGEGMRTLVVAQASDPGSFNPAVTTSGNVHPVTDQIFNGLVGLDEQMNPVAELADRWEIADGGRTYTFTLRTGVRWHDGQPFTSADVKFTFEEMLLEYHSRTRAALRGILTEITTPDAATVVFRFSTPYAPLLQRLDVVEASILPKHLYEGRDPLTAPANLAPVGTGPFRFARYDKGQFVELTRNPAYFRPGLPTLDRVVFRVLPSTSTAVLALERGEIDFAPSVSGPDLPRLRAMPAIVLERTPAGSGGSFCQDVMFPNLARAPFDRIDVRRAIYTALDREFLVERVYFGEGTPSTGPISRKLAWAYTSDVRTYPYDPAAAERLLDGAGLPRGPDGVRFRVTLTHPSNHARFGQAVREQLRRVGIDLALEGLEFNASVAKTFVRKDFDLGLASFCNGADPDIGVRRVYVSSNIAPVPFSNGAGYRSPEVDALFAEAATALDRSARAAVYARIQRILTEDLPCCWIVDTESTRAYRGAFSGFRFWTGAFAETVHPSPGS
jgi:peptide/nickel transport system substrate-binding protein